MLQRISVLLVLALVLSACPKDDGGDDSPTLPPAASMSVDVAVLNAAPLAAKNAPTTATAAPEDYINFANAWIRVKVVQIVATGVVVLPAIAIGLALQQQPVKEGDAWVWTVTANASTAELQVRASLVTGFDVELYISNDELDDYLWVEGTFGDGSGSGEWILHDPAIEVGDDSALSIQWTYVSDTDRALTYEVLSSASDDIGDTFTFAVDGPTATLTYSDADDPSVVADISWDTTTGAGSITVPGFNGGAPACWDDIFENIDCP